MAEDNLLNSLIGETNNLNFLEGTNPRSVYGSQEEMDAFLIECIELHVFFAREDVSAAKFPIDLVEQMLSPSNFEEYLAILHENKTTVSRQELDLFGRINHEFLKNLSKFLFDSLPAEKRTYTSID